jgi:hypothetical protein
VKGAAELYTRIPGAEFDLAEVLAYLERCGLAIEQPSMRDVRVWTQEGDCLSKDRPWVLEAARRQPTVTIQLWQSDSDDVVLTLRGGANYTILIWYFDGMSPDAVRQLSEVLLPLFWCYFVRGWALGFVNHPCIGYEECDWSAFFLRGECPWDARRMRGECPWLLAVPDENLRLVEKLFGKASGVASVQRLGDFIILHGPELEPA